MLVRLDTLAAAARAESGDGGDRRSHTEASRYRSRLALTPAQAASITEN